MQTFDVSTTIDTVYCIIQPHVLQYTHHVKRGRFHQAAEALDQHLVTAYPKEISNESCREASKTLVMMDHSVLRA